MHADPTTTRKQTRAVFARHCGCVTDYVCGGGDVKAGGLTCRNQAVLGFCGALPLDWSRAPFPSGRPTTTLRLISIFPCELHSRAAIVQYLHCSVTFFVKHCLSLLAYILMMSKHIHWWKASRSSQTLKFSLSRFNNTPAHGTVLLHARPLLLFLSSESQPSEHCPD